MLVTGQATLHLKLTKYGAFKMTMRDQSDRPINTPDGKPPIHGTPLTSPDGKGGMEQGTWNGTHFVPNKKQ